VDVLQLPSLLHELPKDRTSLLGNLGRIRREVGPITPELSDALADAMNLRRGDVHEVVSFYSYLQVPLETPRVCIGPVCCAKGARHVPGTEFPVECLGHCDIAPVRLEGEAIAGGVRHEANGFLVEADDVRPVSHVDGDRLIELLRESGLTGMGGAGFPAWRKWEAVRAEPAPRAVVVNADEGEPGTFKDRYLMELRPHLVLEGVELAMRFFEADHAYVYLREEYALARERLTAAIAERGLAIEIVVGAGSYVCGEESAMLESMEGRRGMPRLRPPYPAQYGYLGLPTLISNVETLAQIARIVRGGWSPSRLWSVSGAVARPGCFDGPLDVTSRQLIELAGGATEEIGAIVPGGAASGILPPAALDVPLTREALAEWGCGPGSAGFQVFPASFPVQRLLAETMRFFAEESCQKCTPCRIGNRALHHLFEGKLSMSREKMDEWLDALELTSICGLGQSSPIPVRAALQHWPEVQWSS